jgi:hypothetical protein
VKSAGLRNKPIDRRHLTMDERETYNASGEHGARTQALARTKAYRGQMAYAQNKPMKTVTTTPGTGGMNKGIGIQRQRKVDAAANNERTKGLRPDMGKKPNIYDKLDTSYG